MRRTLALAAVILLAPAAGRAQQCLSYSDGLGNSTVTCPDGRSGYLYTPPGGPPQGLIGGQPYNGVPSGIAPAGQSGAPSAVYVDPPPVGSIAFPPPPVAPEPPPIVGAPSPPLELTPLQRAYQEQRAADLARQRAAERAAKAAPPQ